MKDRFLRWIYPARHRKEQQRGYFDMVRTADVSIGGDQYNTTYVYSPDIAMKLATVYRCTSILSGSIASIPLQMKRKKNGIFVYDEDMNINYLLNVRPNKRQTAYEMMRNAVIMMVNSGNAYIYPEYYGGEVESLTLLSPGSVTYDKLNDIYLVNDVINNIFKTLTSEDIIHLRNMTLDGGYVGESVIRYAARAMGIATNADNKTSDAFQPGATYSGFISGDDKLVTGFGDPQDEQLKTVSDRVESELRANKRIFSLPGSMSFTQLSMSPADIQLLDTRKFSVLDICRFYGVHPDKAFAGQSTNYKASEMTQLLFMTDTLQSLLRQIENEFYVKLVPRSVASRYRLKFNIEDYYQTDIETMTSHMEKSIQWGVKTVNEYRKEKGMPPIEGGDEAMMSCNVAPINSAKIRGEDTGNSENKLNNQE